MSNSVAAHKLLMGNVSLSLSLSMSRSLRSWLRSIHDLRLLGRPSQKRMAAVAALSRGVR
jgi:hypothetical protein